MTIEAEVAALTGATTDLLSAVNVSKATLDEKVATATTQANSATANATQVATVNTVATTQASAAAASALAAATARDQSIAAWVASTAPAEVLPAISQSIHVGAVVKSIIYRTDLDSDGGAWRKRCTDKSWFTETLGGNRWVGQQATIAAAWAAAGSTTGAVFQASATAGPITIGRYYSANSSTTVTEVFRGIAREFPEQVAIVAESARVVIYDLTVPGCPMWMVFVGGGSSPADVNMLTTSTVAHTSVVAVSGRVCTGSGAGIAIVNFLTDSRSRLSIDTSTYNGNIAQRNAGRGQRVSSAISIVNGTVNDVAVTVLPNAVLDTATGLPVPTIAVATAGGLSCITNASTVVNSTVTTAVVSVDFDGRMLKAIRSDGVVAVYDDVTAIAVTPSTTLSAATVPALLGTATRGAVRSKGSSLGVTRIVRNQAVNTRSMVAKITNTFNAGYEIGDSRLAALADTVAETITAPELVVNGTFNTDISGVTVNTNGGTGQAVWGSGGTLDVNGDGTISVSATLSFATVVGVTYRAVFDLIGAASAAGVATSFNSGYFVTSVAYPVQAGNSITFTAVGTTTHLVFNKTSATVCSIDNVSCKRIVPDRSVKNNGLSIVGTLTKTAVSVGSQLVAYSGFGPSNHFEQPYSANLDFGTGDFCCMWWESLSTTSDQVRRFTRGIAGSGQLFGALSGGALTHQLSMLTAGAINSGVLQTLDWNCLCWARESGVLRLYLNGALVYSIANTTNLTNVGAVFRVGTDIETAPVWSGPRRMSMLRISATAPSADQIAQIYRDELALFQPNAQCTVAGTSTAVTALAYDESTDLLHVGTSWGRSGFKGLLRTESEATTTGALTSLSAVQGSVLTGGTSARHYQPALQLRDELARKEEARRALGRTPVFFDFDAIAAQTAFTLPIGYTARAVYSAEMLKREGTTRAYTRSFDGYRETINFFVAPGESVWVSIMAVRSN